MTFPQRGDIYLVEFDPARGHKIQKTQPAVVIQNDIGNRHSPVTIVAAGLPWHETTLVEMETGD